MLQERNEVRSSKGGDLLLIAGLILVILLVRLAMNAMASFAWGGVAQLALFGLLIALCFLLYKKRLCAYRYTLYYQDPPAGELDEFGEQAKNPCPTGTLVAERMMGDKTKSAEVIPPGDMIGLFGPGPLGAILAPEEGGKAPKLHKAVLTTGPMQTAHSLVFKQGGNYYRLVFHPSEEMARLLKDIIAAVRQA